MTLHLSDPAGIIPWNATPGRACGATLGDICNTSEVRGCLVCFVSFDLTRSFPSLTNFSSHPQFYLSYHLYIVAFAGAGATVISLVKPHPIPLIMCCSKYARCHGVLICCYSNPTSHVYHYVIRWVECLPCRLALCVDAYAFYSAVNADFKFGVQRNGDKD